MKTFSGRCGKSCAIKSVNYGSIEVVIHNSEVVQIERKEKFRFGKS